MRLVRKVFPLLLVVQLLLTGCAQGASSSATDSASVSGGSSDASDSVASVPAEAAAMLVVVRGDASERYALGYTGELTGELLLEGLSQLFGVPIHATVEEDATEVTVDFTDSSAPVVLVTPSNEAYSFADSKSYVSCLLDSIAATLQANLEQQTTIHFAHDGGDLVLTYAGVSIPSEDPYTGLSIVDRIDSDSAAAMIADLLLEEYPQSEMTYAPTDPVTIDGKDCYGFSVTLTEDGVERLTGAYAVARDGSAVYRQEGDAYLAMLSKAVTEARDRLAAFLDQTYPEDTVSLMSGGEVDVGGVRCGYFIAYRQTGETLGNFAAEIGGERLFRYNDGFVEILPEEE